MQIAGIPIGDGAPLALIAGLNVLESEAEAIANAQRTQEVAARHGLPLIFKASFDKANRTSEKSERGPGLAAGLAMLTRVKEATGLPLITDVHEPAQAEVAARVVDALQIPAFLCRQTDLVRACALTGRPINIKKGQFVAPSDLEHAVRKLRAFGGRDVMVTDRGTSFGYHDLVADMRGLALMRDFAPVCFDATHAVQHPGRGENGASGGDRRFVAPLARAAVAVGIDALFIEVHPDPERAPCDGPSQLTFEDLDHVLADVRAIADALER